MARQGDERQRNEARRRAEAATRLAAREAAKQASRAADRLQELRRLTAVLEQVEGERLIALHQARDAGATWAQVGKAAGVSAQAAQQRHQVLLTRFPGLQGRLRA